MRFLLLRGEGQGGKAGCKEACVETMNLLLLILVAVGSECDSRAGER